jgi:universal stress protein A
MNRMARQSLDGEISYPRQENIMEFPFMKILCRIDFEDNSIAALNTAARMARDSGGTLEVLHVVPIMMQPGVMPMRIDVYAAEEEAAKAKLIGIAHEHLAGVKYEMRTAVGQPAIAILHAQKTLGADVIVMGTHGRRGFAHFIIGSVAEHVVREADCPVLTIREHHTAEHTTHAHA